MRARIAVAGLFAACFLPAAAPAQELCLYGGPDPNADLACDPSYVARPAAPDIIVEPRTTPAEQGAAMRAAPSMPMRAARGAGRMPMAMAAPLDPAPDSVRMAQMGVPAYAAGSRVPDAYIAAPSRAPRARVSAPNVPPAHFTASADARSEGVPPAHFVRPEPSTTPGFDRFAWRYATPQGPVYAHGHHTAKGWTYDWARQAPPAPIPVFDVPHPGAHARPAPAPHNIHARHIAYVPAPPVSRPPFEVDWRYADEIRLYGESYPRLLYEVQSYYRVIETETVSGGGRSGCGGCGSPVYVVQPAGGPQGGMLYSGGGGGYAAASGLGASVSSSSSSVSARNVATAQQTVQAYAVAGPNETVVSGTPFTPPPLQGSGFVAGGPSAGYAAHSAYVGN